MPNLPRSHPMVPSTLVSASQALHPPALTCLSFSDLPKSLAASADRTGGGVVPELLAITSRLRSDAARRYSPVNSMRWLGQAAAQSLQNRHSPMSSVGFPPGLPWIAPVGQA